MGLKCLVKHFGEVVGAVGPSDMRTRLRAQRANPTLGNILPGFEWPTTSPLKTNARLRWTLVNPSARVQAQIQMDEAI